MVGGRLVLRVKTRKCTYYYIIIIIHTWYGIRYSNDVDGRQQEQDDREDDMDMGILYLGDSAWCAEENRCGDFYDYY